MSKFKAIAEELVEIIGEDNIASATHCATRLRIQVKDRKAIDDSKIEQVSEVKGVFFNAGQYQIILGTGTVNKVFDEMKASFNFEEVSKDEMAADSGNRFQKAIRNLADVFVPIIPVVVATGLFLGLKSVLLNDAFLGLFGASSAMFSSSLLIVISILTDTAFAFLTAFICWSAFNKFGGNPAIGFLIGLMLVSPALPNAWAVAGGTAEPIMIGFIPLVGYQGSILTALITGFVGAKLEKWLRKRMPNSMDLIFTPFFVILVSVLLALFALGPLVKGFESIAIEGIKLFLNLPFGLGGLIIGAIYPLAVMTGMHHMFVMLETSLLASTGFNPIITVCAMYGFANAAVCLAISLRTKTASLKAAGISATATQLLGVSEPALFGIVIRTGMKALGVMVASSALGGMALALLGIQANSYGLAVMLSPLMYLYDTYQLVAYLSVGILTFIFAFVTTNIFVIPKEPRTQIGESTYAPVASKANVLLAPLSGKAVSVMELSDPVFAAKVLGDGVAVLPDNDTVVAPADCTVVNIADTLHAFGLETDDGLEVLIHIGIDTVKLNGKGFTLLCQEGDRVTAGTPLCKVDFDLVKAEGYATWTPVIITNMDAIAAMSLNSGTVTVGETAVIKYEKR